jgi:hypothetical protein
VRIMPRGSRAYRMIENGTYRARARQASRIVQAMTAMAKAPEKKNGIVPVEALPNAIMYTLPSAMRPADAHRPTLVAASPTRPITPVLCPASRRCR